MTERVSAQQRDTMKTNAKRGNWSQTYTGVQFFPLDPRPEDVRIEDIAHALALQCRFAGHCRVPYSVAEHSVRVSWVVEKTAAEDGNSDPRSWALAGLLHDASEAYCVDVPRPIKPYLVGYDSIEHNVMHTIERWAGLELGACSVSVVKRADEVLLMTEKRDIMGPAPAPWTSAQGVVCEPLPEVIVPWGWERAEREFLARFAELRMPL